MAIMKFETVPLQSAYRIKLDSFKDNRGHFSRIFCRNELNEIGHKKEFVQINYSFTKKVGTLRGMHFQYPPKTEIKMVKCLSGKVFDVIVDIRKKSETFLKWHAEILSDKNDLMMYIPEGFAHGFQTLEPDTSLIYFHTEFYNQRYEGGLRYNDPIIDIKWPREIEEISNRDANHPIIRSDFKGI